MQCFFWYVLFVVFQCCRIGTASPVTKPLYDNRLYSTYTLDNGISAVSIQHKDSPKSGYAAAVGVGSLFDPIETQGLAHLLEHMLFLGTKTHPGTSSYNDYLSQHGGNLNAWTADERTVFHNQIDNEAFADALERFSEFFSEPLLNGTSQKKEILAVDAEHQKNVPSDNRRMWATLQFLFSYPLNHFSTGNQETLDKIPQTLGIDIFDYLRKLHTTYYCGTNIALVTLSPSSIEEQKVLAQRYFGKVDSTNGGNCKKWVGGLGSLPQANLTLANSNEILRFFHSKPALPDRVPEVAELLKGEEDWREDQLRGLSREEGWDVLRTSGPIVTQMKANGQHTVWLAWSLPSTESLYAEKPLYYLRYMVAYGGRNSMEKDLINRRWINSLTVDEASTSLGTLLVVEFTPTDLGRDHLWDVIKKLIGYINDVRDNGVDERVLASLVKQSDVLFSITEPGKDVGETVADIADALLYVEDPKDVLTSRSTVAHSNVTLIQRFLDLLTTERLFVVIADPKWEPPVVAKGNFTLLDKGRTIYRSDPFYTVEHTISSIPIHRVRSLIDATTIQASSPQPREARADRMTDPTSLIQLTGTAAEVNDDVDNASSVVQLAPPISHLPETLVAYNHSSPGSAPEILSLTPALEIWWRGAGTHPTPRARIRLVLRYPASEINLESAVASQLFCTVVNDVISTKLADFSDAGYNAAIHSSGTAFNVEITGFSEKKSLHELMVLLGSAIEESLHGTTESRYQRLRHEYMNALADFSSSRPTRLSMQTIRAVLLNNAFLREDILMQLKSGDIFQSYDGVATRVRTRLRAVHTTGLTMGLSKSDTSDLIRTFLMRSGLRTLFRRQAADSLTVDLTSPLEVSLPNPVPGDSSDAALLLFRTDFPTSIEDWVETQILGNMLGTKVMEQLRTVRQLGYTAGAAVQSLSSLLRVVAYVEGPRESAADEMRALEEVVDEIGRNLSSLPESELQQWRMALKGDLSVTLINSDDEYNRLWTEVGQGLYCFQRQELQSKYLQDDSIWNNSASTILSQQFQRLTRSSGSIKMLMHHPEEQSNLNNNNNNNNFSTAFFKFSTVENERPNFSSQSKQYTLSTQNITKFQKQFGFLPISSVCALNRRTMRQRKG